MGGPKYHHYVPRTYLRAWQDNENKIWVYKKEDNSLLRHSTVETVLGENHFYSLGTDNFMAQSQDDLKEIFKPLDTLRVTYNNNELKTLEQYRDFYYEFDKWDITRLDETPVSKKRLRSEIERIKIKRLESGWDIIENRWADLRAKIEESINLKESKLDTDDIEYLEMFMAGQEWRTPASIEQYKALMMEIEPIAEMFKDIKEYEPDALEEFATSLFLKNIGRFQENDTSGAILRGYDKAKETLSFMFIKAIGTERFLTSDNPVFNIIDNSFEGGKYNGQYMALSPEIIIGRYKGDNKTVGFTTSNDYMVIQLNKKIIQNTYKMYVSSCKINS